MVKAWSSYGEREIARPSMRNVAVNRDLWVHYLSYGNVARWRRARVREAWRQDPPDPDSFPKPRILMNVVDLEAHSTKTFRADRVVEVADFETGEISDLASILKAIGFDAGIVDGATKTVIDRVRTIEHDLSFDGVNNGLAGWHFHVPPAFRVALDLSDLPRGGQRSQGMPPAYGFSVGDTFYDNAAARRLAWGDALWKIDQAVQVVEAIADQPDGPRSVRDGYVVADIYRSDGEKLHHNQRTRMCQREFADFLRTGLISRE